MPVVTPYPSSCSSVISVFRNDGYSDVIVVLALYYRNSILKLFEIMYIVFFLDLYDCWFLQVLTYQFLLYYFLFFSNFFSASFMGSFKFCISVSFLLSLNSTILDLLLISCLIFASISFMVEASSFNNLASCLLLGFSGKITSASLFLLVIPLCSAKDFCLLSLFFLVLFSTNFILRSFCEGSRNSFLQSGICYLSTYASIVWFSIWILSYFIFFHIEDELLKIYSQETVFHLDLDELEDTRDSSSTSK